MVVAKSDRSLLLLDEIFGPRTVYIVDIHGVFAVETSVTADRALLLSRLVNKLLSNLSCYDGIE